MQLLPVLVRVVQGCSQTQSSGKALLADAAPPAAAAFAAAALAAVCVAADVVLRRPASGHLRVAHGCLLVGLSSHLPVQGHLLLFPAQLAQVLHVQDLLLVQVLLQLARPLLHLRLLLHQAQLL